MDPEATQDQQYNSELGLGDGGKRNSPDLNTD